MANFYIQSGTGAQVTDPTQLNPTATYTESGTGKTGLGSSFYSAPAAQAPASPTPLPATPAASSVNYSNAAGAGQGSVVPSTSSTTNPTQNLNLTTPTQNTSTQPTTQQTPQQPTQSPTPPATSNLGPGSTGQDVSALQNYLVQMGYLTPQQISGGQGTYGPTTTAAVAKLQQDLGINASSGQGYFGPQTQAALSQKYQGLHQTMQGSAVPDSSAEASAAITTALTPQNIDPVFGSMASMMEPIMNSLTQVLNNINNPALTATSLQSEYNDLATQNNLPAMQASMLNMTNIMNGTEQDIRDEVASTGGTVTDSQVQAMATARNKVILKQYNAVSSQYQAAYQNVQNMMQYASQDQQTDLQRQQMTASITTSMASIESQMMQMGMTMQNNARSAVQYNVTQMGYQGLAQSANGDPQTLSYYENILGLPSGSLSNPETVSQMDTYKNQQLQLNNYKAAISAYTAGYGGGIPGMAYQTNAYLPGAVNTGGQVGITPVDSTQLTRPPWLSTSVPLSMSADEMEQYMSTNKAATTDPGTNNIVAPGVGYYLQQSDGSYVLKAALPDGTAGVSNTIDQQYSQIKQTINTAQANPVSMSPTITRKWSLTTNAAISSYEGTGTYKVISNIAPYLANIRAASQNPSSVSDLELLDSYVRASKGGSGQVTSDQIDTILKGSSLGDTYEQLENKLQNGGVLSSKQRADILTLSQGVYGENQQDYQKIYVQAMQNLQAQGVPPQFWGNFPDFTSLLTQ